MFRITNIMPSQKIHLEINVESRCLHLVSDRDSNKITSCEVTYHGNKNKKQFDIRIILDGALKGPSCAYIFHYLFRGIKTKHVCICLLLHIVSHLSICIFLFLTISDVCT
jgi:hypothetical protein